MFRHRDLPAELLLQKFRKSLCGGRLSMHHEGLFRRLLKASGPSHQGRLVGVRRESIDTVDRRAHRDVIAEDAYTLSTIHQVTAKCSLCLEAGKQNTAFLAR